MVDEIDVFHKKDMIDESGKSYKKLTNKFVLDKDDLYLVRLWYDNCHRCYRNSKSVMVGLHERCNYERKCKILLIKLGLL